MTDRLLFGYRLVEVQHDDTLQHIAARELGDASKWVDVAAINSLVPPYLTGDPGEVGPGVKLFGETILVPASTSQATATADPDRVFGVDLSLVGGNLTATDGDFDLMSGRPNLRQALVHRIVTDTEELLFHLPYGCAVRRVAGTANGPAAGLIAAQYVRSALLLDPRIAAVLSVVADVVGDAVTITAQVQPITGANIDFSAAV